MKHDREIEALVDAAFDESGMALDSEDARFGQFQRMGKALRLKLYEAPTELIQAARELLPESSKGPIWARLVSSSLTLAGARAASSETFQLVFEAKAHRTRLLYAKDARGWEIVGQAPPGWEVRRAGRNLKLDPEGRFTFRVRNLDESGLMLIDDGLEIHIPSATLAQTDEPGSPR